MKLKSVTVEIFLHLGLSELLTERCDYICCGGSYFCSACFRRSFLTLLSTQNTTSVSDISCDRFDAFQTNVEHVNTLSLHELQVLHATDATSVQRSGFTMRHTLTGAQVYWL